MYRLASVPLLMALLCCAAAANAQERGFAINHLDLSERGSEWFSTDSLDLRGAARPALGIVGEWAFRPLEVSNDRGQYVRSIVRNQFVLHPGLSVVLWDRLRLAIDVPIQVYADGKQVIINGQTFAPPQDKTSFGDVRLAAALRLFGTYGDAITGALGVQVQLPTGSKEAYAGDGDTRVSPHLLLAGDISLFVYAAKAGVTFRTSDNSFGNLTVGPYMYYALSAGLRLANSKFVIGPELFGRTLLTHDQFFKRRTTPAELMFGLHWMLVDGFRVGAGIGFGLNEAFGSPDRRGLLSIEWVPTIEPAAPPPPADRDGDGVLDIDDACPDVAGVPTNDSATNGCPPPRDRDHDGVLDADDACPYDPGEKTDDPKTNGCPPPPDQDGDGILDADDACPTDPGVHTDDPQTNGCPPPPDRDGDGVLDADDACPDDPGLASSIPRRNGCPKAFVQGNQIKILDQVKFKTGKAVIEPGPESEDVLQAVQQVLRDHPEVKTIRVEGHTDNRGRAEMNRKLSRSRAQAVVDWLLGHGIEPKRLTSDGFGPDRPIDDNTTEEGRKNNRRVEFHIADEAKTVQ